MICSLHTAVCGSSVRQAVARPRHRQSVCIHNIHVAATCRPSVLGSATKTQPPVAKQSGQCAGALNIDVCFNNEDYNIKKNFVDRCLKSIESVFIVIIFRVVTNAVNKL